MFNLIPLILILVSLGVLIVIVGRKFSALANLDVDSIPAEREAKFKEKILSNRLKRNFFKYYSRLGRVVFPLGQGLGRMVRTMYERLISFKEDNAGEEVVEADKEQAAQRLFFEAEELIKGENYDEAEKRYIAIIALDSKNVAAFKELGRLYFSRKDYHEAKQTLEHARRLAEKNGEYSGGGVNDDRNGRLAGLYFDLALVCRAMELPDEASGYVAQALNLEPNNPRYLDTKLEIGIMNKDKVVALEAYERLEEVNPDNNKLPEFKKQIKEL